MSEIITWQDKPVEVQARMVPRYLWSTASIEVFLDGQLILSTGGQIKFTGSQSTRFNYSGASHTAELNWGGSGFGFSFPYRLVIDGVPVSAARVRVRNWPIGVIAAIAIAAVLVMIFHFV